MPGPPEARASIAKPDMEPATDKEERLARYHDVVDRAQLNFVQLIGLSFNVSPEYFSEMNKKRGIRPSLSYGIDIESTVFDKKSGDCGIFLTCSVSSKKKEKELVVCNADYLVSYSNLHGCEQEAVEVFLGKVGRFACYPYFRSLFASLDWSANTNMPILPVLREEPKKAKSDNEEPT